MKLFRILALTLAIAFAGQNSFAGDTKLGGVRLGWQQSSLIYNGDLSGFENPNPLNTFYIGVYKNNKILPTLNWTSGLEYFQTGFDDEDKLTVHTLSIPLALKVKVGPVFALGGAAANFKIGENFESSDPDLVKPNLNTFDLPLFLGAGFNFLIFNIEARYHWGMLDVDKDISGFRNRYLQIGVGAEF